MYDKQIEYLETLLDYGGDGFMLTYRLQQGLSTLADVLPRAEYDRYAHYLTYLDKAATQMYDEAREMLDLLYENGLYDGHIFYERSDI